MARTETSMDQAELAAQTAMPDALFELGMLYATGRDVAANLVVAHKWFNLAAARGNSSALNYRVEARPRDVFRADRRSTEARPRMAPDPLAHQAEIFA